MRFGPLDLHVEEFIMCQKSDDLLEMAIDEPQKMIERYVKLVDDIE